MIFRKQNEDRSLKWTSTVVDDVTNVELHGDLDENATLGELQGALSGKVRLILGKVKRINSAGVREWVNFIREAEKITDTLVLVDCSPAFVAQMNMIYNFRGGAQVASFYAPFVCPACDSEQDMLIQLDANTAQYLPDKLPEFHCSTCGEALEFDDIPERYFAFLGRE